jgi:hypothetical protein
MVLALSFLGMGCDRVASQKVPNTEGTDRLWVESNTYCARKPNGLICWEAAPGNLTAHEPTVFEGVGKVTSLALRQGEGCAISDLGMGCFRLTDKHLARGGTGVPQNFVAFGATRRMFCARGAEGVSCFQDKIEKMLPYPVFEKPRDLHPTLSGKGACAEYEYEIRCFTTAPTGDLQATVRVQGVRGVAAVHIDEEQGTVLVLDRDGLKFRAGKAAALRGRAPVDEVAKNFPDSASIDLELVKSVLGGKKLTADSTGIYVLDEQGVKSVTVRPEGVELQLWPMEYTPSDLWQGRGGTFFVAHDGKLSMHGTKGEERIERLVRSVRNPKDVGAGEHFTCIVHDEGISCVKNGLD